MSIVFCLFNSICLCYLTTSISELFFHRFMLHLKYFEAIANYWKYDLNRHKLHHKRLINGKMEYDKNKKSLNDCKVTSFDFVILAATIAFLLHSLILYLFVTILIRNNNNINYYYDIILSSMIGIYCYFSIWYLLEDHFHIGIHSKWYRANFIQNTFLKNWFEFVYKYHYIHHLFPNKNYTFIYPFADYIFNSFKSFKSFNNKNMNSIDIWSTNENGHIQSIHISKTHSWEYIVPGR